MAEIDDRWLSVDEICKYLKISKDTVYKWIDKYEMPLVEWVTCGSLRKIRWIHGLRLAARPKKLTNGMGVSNK